MFGKTDNDVVEEVDLNDFGGLSELSCGTYVGLTWGGISGWVVVGAHERRGAVANGFPEDFTRVDEAGGSGSGGHCTAAQETVFAVQREHPEFLNSIPVCHGDKPLVNALRAIEEGGSFA